LVGGVPERPPAAAFGPHEKTAADQHRRVTLVAGVRQIDSGEERVVADRVRRVTVRIPPEVFARVHVDGGGAAVRWLQDRNAVDRAEPTPGPLGVLDHGLAWVLTLGAVVPTRSGREHSRATYLARLDIEDARF